MTPAIDFSALVLFYMLAVIVLGGLAALVRPWLSGLWELLEIGEEE